jgi:GNAT superfamily N-acetyltransferase
MAPTIRPIAPHDYEPAAALFAVAYPDRAREADEWTSADRAAPGQRLVAVAGDPERLVGYAAFWRVRDDRHRMDLVVAPDRRRRGIGGGLLARIVERAREIGAATLQARADDDQPESLAFLRRRGFAETMRMHWDVLDLRAADLARFAHLAARLEADGIRVTTLRDEEPREPACWERLADLHHAAQDGWADPDPGPPGPPLTVEEARRWFMLPGLIPEAFFIAAAGDTYVGYSGIAVRPSEPDVGWPAGTVVRPEHRGRGVATALKARVLAYARACRLTRVHSSSGNPAILHINRKFGFRPVWSEVRLVRALDRRPERSR